MKAFIFQVVLLSYVCILCCHSQGNGYFSYSFLAPKKFFTYIDNGVKSDHFLPLSYKKMYSNEVPNNPIQYYGIWNKIINRCKMFEPFSLIKTDVQLDVNFKKLNDNSLKRIHRQTNENDTIAIEDKKNTSISSIQTTLATVISTTTSDLLDKSDKSSKDKIKNNTEQLSSTTDKLTSSVLILSSTSTLTPSLFTAINRTEHNNDKSSFITSGDQTSFKPFQYFSAFSSLLIVLGLIFIIYKKRQQGRQAFYQVGNIICRGKNDTSV